MSHMLLAMLADIDDSRARGIYDRLRTASNSCRASHSVPIPPLDEWQGMGAICAELNCMYVFKSSTTRRIKTKFCAVEITGFPPYLAHVDTVQALAYFFHKEMKTKSGCLNEGCVDADASSNVYTRSRHPGLRYQIRTTQP